MDVLSTKTQCNLNNAEKYFKEHLQLGDYYSQENIVSGEWAGIGAEQLGLTGRVKEDQFLKLCHNQNPQTGELLTQRMKTTRWDSDKMADGCQSPDFLRLHFFTAQISFHSGIDCR